MVHGSQYAPLRPLFSYSFKHEASRSLKQKWRSFGYALTPALVTLFFAICIAAIMGGPIAAVLTGFVFTAALLVNSVLVLLLSLKLTSRSTLALMLMGFATYVVSILAILTLWSLFGTSQIM